MGVATPFGCGKYVSTPPMRRVDFQCGRSGRLCSDCVVKVSTDPESISDTLESLGRMAAAFVEQGDGEWADVPNDAAALIQALSTPEAER